MPKRHPDFVDFKLTDDFWLREFYKSSDHPEILAEMEPNIIANGNIYVLCKTILQPTRHYFNVRMTTLSGYRDEALNSAVSKYKFSSHRYGKAVDITTGKKELLYEIYCYIREALPYAYEQLIYYKNRRFIHVAMPNYGGWKIAEIRE